MIGKRSLIGLALVLTVMCGSASAGYVTVRDRVGGENASGDGPGFFKEGTGSIIKATFNGGAYDSAPIGVFDFESNSGSGFQQFYTYCINPTQGILFGVNPSDNVGLVYQTDGLQNSLFSAAEVVAAEVLYGSAFDDSLTGRIEAAAFQSVLWELAMDDSFNLEDGLFRLDDSDPHTNAVKSLAQEWWDKIANNTWTNQAHLIALRNSNSQDFVTHAPEPATGLAMLLGLGGLAWYRKRQSV